MQNGKENLIQRVERNNRRALRRMERCNALRLLHPTSLRALFETVLDAAALHGFIVK